MTSDFEAWPLLVQIYGAEHISGDCVDIVLTVAAVIASDAAQCGVGQKAG